MGGDRDADSRPCVFQVMLPLSDALFLFFVSPSHPLLPVLRVPCHKFFLSFKQEL